MSLQIELYLNVLADVLRLSRWCIALDGFTLFVDQKFSEIPFYPFATHYAGGRMFEKRKQGMAMWAVYLNLGK